MRKSGSEFLVRSPRSSHSPGSFVCIDPHRDEHDSFSSSSNTPAATHANTHVLTGLQKRSTCVCNAAPAQNRREALALGLAAAAAALVPGAAQANSGAPKNASAASMSSFTMEGTKKQGVSPGRKAKVLNKLKEQIAAGDLS